MIYSPLPSPPPPHTHRYPDDMGPLRPKIIKNMGLRSEPILETRVNEYTEFLNRGGVIENGERVITCVRGGGVAIVTSLPEVLDKKCTRMGINYKLGDVTIIVDMLTKLAYEIDPNNPKPAGSVEYMKNNTGKMLQRTMLLSDLILPCDLHSINRKQLLTYEVLGLDRRINGMDVLRLQLSEIEVLREREGDIFCSLDR